MEFTDLYQKPVSDTNPNFIYLVIRKMSSVEKKIDFDDNCCICLEALRFNQCIMTKPCGHVYHRECAATLTRCSLCRKQIMQKEILEMPHGLNLFIDSGINLGDQSWVYMLKPVPEAIPEPVPEVISEPVPEVISEPVPEVISEPVPEVISVPVPEVISVPVRRRYYLIEEAAEAVVRRHNQTQIRSEPVQESRELKPSFWSRISKLIDNAKVRREKDIEFENRNKKYLDAFKGKPPQVAMDVVKSMKRDRTPFLIHLIGEIQNFSLNY